MAKLSDLLPAEDMTQLHGLPLFARTVMEGFSTGLHASPQTGSSVEFRQHRPYVQGDEIKRLDWKIFGRSDRFYIREFDEETNLRATLLLDASGSMSYRGTKGVIKFEQARKLAAALAYVLTGQQDAVGLVTFDSKVREFIPCRTKITHLHNILETLLRTEPGADTSLAAVLQNLAGRLNKRGLLMLISDGFDDAEEILRAVGVLRKQGHDIIFFQMWDRDEIDFPFSRWSRYENLENVEDFLLLDPAAVRQRYLQVLAKFRDDLSEGLRKHQVDLVPIFTDEPLAAAVKSYLALRIRRYEHPHVVLKRHPPRGRSSLPDPAHHSPAKQAAGGDGALGSDASPTRGDAPEEAQREGGTAVASHHAHRHPHRAGSLSRATCAELSAPASRHEQKLSRGGAGQQLLHAGTR